jgi:hypothetical protein
MNISLNRISIVALFASALFFPLLFLFSARAQNAAPQNTQSPNAPPPNAPPQIWGAEREQIVAFWSAPHRYEVLPRETTQAEGPWAVRLSPAASLWQYRYQKLFVKEKILPTQNTITPANSGRDEWEKWISAKVAYDNWRAAREVAALNAPFVKNAALVAAPPFPGPIPLELQVELGNPPPFAVAALPKKYVVRFDDYTATYHDQLGANRPRNVYFRFDEGVAHMGVALKNWPDNEARDLFARSGLSPSEQKVCMAVSRFEGGFESVNTYDTGFVSVGFIQFASLSEGSGSLGGMMLRYKQADPQNFNSDFHRFGIDVSPAGVLQVLDPATGAQLGGADANAKIIADKRLIAVFQRAGKLSEAFRIAQIQAAKARFYPANFKIQISVNGKEIEGRASDVIRSEAGLATLFDRSVNIGNIRVLNVEVQKVMQENKLETLAQVAPFEREIIRRLKWRGDFLADKTLSQPQ